MIDVHPKDFMRPENYYEVEQRVSYLSLTQLTRFSRNEPSCNVPRTIKDRSRYRMVNNLLHITNGY